MITRLVTVALLAGGMLASGSAAQASARSFNDSCFGYTGTFKSGSDVLKVDWEDPGSGVDECFGVAPDRTIWHAWPGSGGWQEMPNNGRADNMATPFYSITGRRAVAVVVASTDTVYCSVRNAGPGWGVWHTLC
jgi:hypothetical protein